MDATELTAKFGIGLTGGVATGKSTVARMILAEGFPVFDADVLSKRVMQPGGAAYDQILSIFGKDYLRSDGTWDRPKLRHTIFSNPELKKKLEAIVHVEIRQQLALDLEHAGLLAEPRYWFYEAALIVEANIIDRFHSIWVTWCDESLQLQRLMAREGIDAEEAKGYLLNQMPAGEKAKHGHVIIDTSGDLAAVNEQVRQALADLDPAVID